MTQRMSDQANRPGRFFPVTPRTQECLTIGAQTFLRDFNFVFDTEKALPDFLGPHMVGRASLKPPFWQAREQIKIEIPSPSQ